MGASKEFLKGLLDNPNFKKWFGESAMRDAEGLPLEVYHGTRADFDAFDLGKQGSGSGLSAGGSGVYFTDDIRNAAPYTRDPKTGEYDGKVLRGFLNLRNPYTMGSGEWSQEAGREAADALTSKLKAAGHDGVIVDHAGAGNKEYIAFEPQQFKHSLNQGTFDPTDPNFLKSAGLMTAGTGAAYGLARNNDGSVSVGPGEAEAARLFHGTTIDGLRGIRKTGKINGPAYFTPERGVAEDYARGGPVVSVEVPDHKLNIDYESRNFGDFIDEATGEDTIDNALGDGAAVYTNEDVPVSGGKFHYRDKTGYFPLGLGLTGAGAYGLMGGDSDANAMSYIGPKGMANFLGPDVAKSMLSEAEQLAAKGVDNEAIRQATGVFKGMDGKWRYELDDSGARYRPGAGFSQAEKEAAYSPDTMGYHDALRLRRMMDEYGVGLGDAKILFKNTTGRDFPEGGWGLLAKQNTPEKLTDLAQKSLPSRENWRGTVGQVLDHPALYEAGGELDRLGFSMTSLGGARGGFNGVGVAIDPSHGYSLETGKGTLFHELQHALQGQEGFARGGSPEGMAREQSGLQARVTFLNKELSRLAREMDKHPRGTPEHSALKREYDAAMGEKMDVGTAAFSDPYEQYQNLAGEIEARDVSKRMNFTPEQRRATPPDLRDNAIVRFDGNEAASVPAQAQAESPSAIREFLDTVLRGAKTVGNGIDSASKTLGPLVMNAPSRFATAAVNDPVGTASQVADFVVPFKGSAQDYADAFYHNQDATWLDKLNALAGIGLDAAFMGHGNQAKTALTGLMRY